MTTAGKEFLIRLWLIDLLSTKKRIVMLELHKIHKKCSKVLELPGERQQAFQLISKYCGGCKSNYGDAVG